MAGFRETHLLGDRWWFWALLGANIPSIVLDPPGWDVLILLPVAAVVCGAFGYVVVADQDGIRVRPVGVMAMFQIVYPFLWRRLQAPAEGLVHASVVRRRGIGRVFSWPLLWFGRTNQMDFGAPYRLDTKRRDGRRVRIGVRDGPVLIAVLEAHGHGNTARGEAATVPPRPVEG